ncbi:MAG: CAP domain-containing protein, partial [Acidimicrobiia bacterium]
DARFFGSTGGIRLNRPIVGMAATPTGRGYWMVASDGGIFSFGDARFFGSTGGIRLNRPIVDMASVPNGQGYVMVAEDGGVFLFGQAQFYGSAAGACPGAPASGVAMSRTSPGYWITFGDARTYAFTPTSAPPRCASDAAGAAAQDFFSRLNAERAARGRPALAWDGGLAGYATMWSRDMAVHGFRHSNLSNMWGVGSYNSVGENIAMGNGPGTTAGMLHTAWMRSDGHRRNMLSGGFDVVGIGVYCAPDGSMWATTSFGHRSAAGPSSGAGAVPPLNPIVRGDAGSTHC